MTRGPDARLRDILARLASIADAEEVMAAASAHGHDRMAEVAGLESRIGDGGFADEGIDFGGGEGGFEAGEDRAGEAALNTVGLANNESALHVREDLRSRGSNSRTIDVH